MSTVVAWAKARWQAGRMAPVRPLPGEGRGPRRLVEGVDRVLAGLGAPDTRGVAEVFERWNELVGAGMADRTRPVRLSRSRLVVAATDPTAASHLRFLEPQLLDRLAARLGPGRVTGVDVTVERPGARRSASREPRGDRSEGGAAIPGW